MGLNVFYICFGKQHLNSKINIETQRFGNNYTFLLNLYQPEMFQLYRSKYTHYPIRTRMI